MNTIVSLIPLYKAEKEVRMTMWGEFAQKNPREALRIFLSTYPPYPSYFDDGAETLKHLNLLNSLTQQELSEVLEYIDLFTDEQITGLLGTYKKKDFTRKFAQAVAAIRLEEISCAKDNIKWRVSRIIKHIQQDWQESIAFLQK
ncbi:MAG: hypothetical protein ACD_2C00042G0004 [uncultured bacterium (gcode 4)]|uniref:Uncharacterized protein n=1 Tax=uncultured bacterium (gcode 4) TaxID=1234023 RepID=K2H2N8_9BACT|nr:MAG: hypothetical protein ACD_2C00042G0004 [uncultured bacterium (gcode 4)]